jgi:perosamine synthetase
MERIPVSGPSITQKEIEYVADAAANAWYSQANMYHERFETAFAAYVGTRFASALPSCTSAIHLALLALGIGPGDEVIIPDVTWIASAAPISYVGATPVFADIDPQSWCLAAASFEECLTPRTKAVIPVDLYGNMPNMGALSEIAVRSSVAIVEDAAEAIGSEYQGQKAGSFGSAGVFSFHGSKTLTTGEGGMLVTDSEALYRRVLFLRDHGRNPGEKLFFNTEIGYKYKMSSMQAALGLAQLERIEELIAYKRRIFDWYAAELGDLAGITLNDQPSATKNTYWMVTVILDPHYEIEKDDLVQLMSEAGIDCRPFFRPLSSLPAYAHTEQAQQARQRNTISYRLSPFGINLPCGMNMTEEKVGYVCAALKRILRRGE